MRQERSVSGLAGGWCEFRPRRCTAQGLFSAGTRCSGSRRETAGREQDGGLTAWLRHALVMNYTQEQSRRRGPAPQSRSRDCTLSCTRQMVNFSGLAGPDDSALLLWPESSHYQDAAGCGWVPITLYLQTRAMAGAGLWAGLLTPGPERAQDKWASCWGHHHFLNL